MKKNSDFWQRDVASGTPGTPPKKDNSKLLDDDLRHLTTGMLKLAEKEIDFDFDGADDELYEALWDGIFDVLCTYIDYEENQNRN